MNLLKGGSMFRRIKPQSDVVTIYIDDKPFNALAGEPIANVLLNEGFSSVHRAPNGNLRGPYCMMGVCFDCMITLQDGRVEQACQIYAEDGVRLYLPMNRSDRTA
ncbi:MAG: (2Fe-2S)-binding protein [Rhodospirillaceae bacterium]|nr:(2Fe-2S)-binding protein [Rhodospirillaceae bacterium]